MIPLLANIPAKLKTIIDRLTAARAANLDNIDSTTMSYLDSNVSDSKPVRKTQIFTSSETWARPTGVDSVRVLLVGGGAGGGGVAINAAAYSASGGGGGGQVVEADLAVTGNLTITIGSGGAGGSGATNGTDGGDSTITGGASLTAYGGTGGGYAPASTGGTASAGGNGNTGGGGTAGSRAMAGSGAGAFEDAYNDPNMAQYNGFGTTSSYGYSGSVCTLYAGRNSRNKPGRGKNGYGGGGVGGVGHENATVRSYFAGSPGDGGGAAGFNAPGGNANAYGGGGGGTADANPSGSLTGGNGYQGVCIITWWE